jgi:hypothetical protein
LARFPRSDAYKFFWILCNARAHVAALEAHGRDEDRVLGGGVDLPNSTKLAYLDDDEEEDY